LLHDKHCSKYADFVKTSSVESGNKQNYTSQPLFLVSKNTLIFSGFRRKLSVSLKGVKWNLSLSSPAISLNCLSLPFDGHAARHFGRIRAYLAKAGNPIAPYDL
jgi:hypothetical protein